ncbi:MAG: tetratricopeptide repeat protein [Chloroflexia bacterium]|nr:tetratricopeptide repeat protein [Chloroflexia bacterium]
MADLLQTLAPYVPYSLLRRAARAPAVPTEPLAERFPAAVLFADVSGFSPLTESLAHQSAEGPEELTRLLNAYFGRIISLIEAEGGEVVKFGGDAVMVVFPARDEPLGQAGRRALQAAEAMQAAMADFATLDSSVGQVSLEMKIGIAAGEVLAMQVGGVHGHWEYVIAGDPLRQVAEAEGRAGRGEIVLSPEAAALMHPHALPPRPLQPPDWTRLSDPEAAVAVLRCFVPAPVLAWLDRGLYDWLAVLRPMSVLFIGVSGLDYGRPGAVETLHLFLQSAQQVLGRYQGNLSRFSVDDKGTILLALFGAPPFSHGDDPARAVRCALDLQAMLGSEALRGAALRLDIGVTTGHLFAGPVGGETRREYTVMGPAANMAARLMVRAKSMPPGEGIVCDRDTYQQAQLQVDFESLVPIRAKGKKGVTYIYRPTEAIVGSRLAGQIQYPLVGREEELGRLLAAMEAVEAGESRVLVVVGEAGLGKTRLVAELDRLLQEHGLDSLYGSGRSTEQQSPYRAWRDILEAYFGLDESMSAQVRQERVQQLSQQFAPDQLQRLPLLNDLLNLSLPDTELTATLDPALRQQSLTVLLLSLLRGRAGEQPLVLILENAQWLDSLSWELAVYGARALAGSGNPLLLVLLTRPLEAHSLGAEHLSTLDLLVDVEEIHLGPLAAESLLAMIRARFDLPEEGLPRPLARLVQRRAQGNPFYAEQLVLTLREKKTIRIEADPERKEDPRGPVCRCLIQGDLDEAGRTLPDTVQGLVLERIDRLPPEQQLTLRVAAVIGSPFAYRTLRYTAQQHTSIDEAELQRHLQQLAALDLTPLHTPEPDLAYAFKNVVTRDVAYETLLFAQRRALHRSVAQWYEQHDRQQMSSLRAAYPLLVYHYCQARDLEREQHYAKLAGEQAAAQFANAEAVAYLSRALELTATASVMERYALLLARERVYDVMGDRQAQHRDLEALEHMLEVEQAAVGGPSDWEGMLVAIRRAELALRRARYAEATGDYAAAVEAARETIDLSQEVGRYADRDEANAPLGLKANRLQAAGYLQWGQALWRRGYYEIAQVWLERALEGARDLGEARIEADALRLLGAVSRHLGDERAAQDYFERALALYRERGDRRGESAALDELGYMTHRLGDLEQARLYHEQALSIQREIGDRQGEGTSLQSLGVVEIAQGAYALAAEHVERSLRIYREIADRRGEGLALRLLGDVLRYQGDYAGAQEYYEQALEILRAIGDPRSEGLALANRGRLALRQGRYREARDDAQGARWIGQDLGDQTVLRSALLVLGHTLLEEGKLPEAAEAYEQVLESDSEAPRRNPEALAGLAQVALAQGDRPRARSLAQGIMADWEGGLLGGPTEPLRLYWSCYEVLRVVVSPQAREVLIDAYGLLRERLPRVGDARQQQRWLERMPQREITRERERVVRRYARLLRAPARELV